MPIKKITARSLIFVVLLGCNIAFCEKVGPSLQDMQEFERDNARAAELDSQLPQDSSRDLATYEAFADSLEQKWQGRNKEYYARLMLSICIPLSSGAFNGIPQYQLARKYALSALTEPDSIPLMIELELTGRVKTFIFGPNASKGDDLSKKRREDIFISLHAWKRLVAAINPDWNPDEYMTWEIPMPPLECGFFVSGMDPAGIKDSAMRAEYEEELMLHDQKVEESSKQYSYRQWLKWYPQNVENSIIGLYSYPPYATAELKAMLNEYQIDQAAKTRILEAVEKNIREAEEGKR